MEHSHAIRKGVQLCSCMLLFCMRSTGAVPEHLVLKIPASFAELKDVRHTLEVYREACPWRVAFLLLSIYLFCQVPPLLALCPEATPKLAALLLVLACLNTHIRLKTACMAGMRKCLEPVTLDEAALHAILGSPNFMACLTTQDRPFQRQMLMQVFMMPGSSFLNVLAGSLLGTATAIPVVAVISTLGASGSYLLSRLVVKVLPLTKNPPKITPRCLFICMHPPLPPGCVSRCAPAWRAAACYATPQGNNPLDTQRGGMPCRIRNA